MDRRSSDIIAVACSMSDFDECCGCRIVCSRNRNNLEEEAGWQTTVNGAKGSGTLRTFVSNSKTIAYGGTCTVFYHACLYLLLQSGWESFTKVGDY